MLRLEAEDRVGAQAVAEHDGDAGLVELRDGVAQGHLEVVGLDVQVRLELAAVDALRRAFRELAGHGRTGEQDQPCRLASLVVLLLRRLVGHAVTSSRPCAWRVTERGAGGHPAAGAPLRISQLSVTQPAASAAASAMALTLASGASIGMSQPDCRM